VNGTADLRGCWARRVQVYNHHAALKVLGYSTSSAGFLSPTHTSLHLGFSSPAKLKAPFQFVIEQPSTCGLETHLIHVGGKPGKPNSGHYSRRLTQCPCTPQHVFNYTASTINGRAADPPFADSIPCPDTMSLENNDACYMQNCTLACAG
jgi:hypothetical protein